MAVHKSTLTCSNLSINAQTLLTLSFRLSLHDLTTTSVFIQASAGLPDLWTSSSRFVRICEHFENIGGLLGCIKHRRDGSLKTIEYTKTERLQSLLYLIHKER